MEGKSQKFHWHEQRDAWRVCMMKSLVIFEAVSEVWWLPNSTLHRITHCTVYTTHSVAVDNKETAANFWKLKVPNINKSADYPGTYSRKNWENKRPLKHLTLVPVDLES